MVYTTGVITFALFMGFFYALADCYGSPGAPDGTQNVGHAENHGFYQYLYNNKTRTSCCHDRDCRPTVSRMVGDHYEVKINGKWWPVDKDTIIPKSAPDGGAHVCAGDPSQIDPLGRVYCVVLPPET